MIYAADAAHDIQPLCVCMIGYPFFYMPKGKKYSAAKIKMWYNEKAGSEETETAANHDRLKKGQAKQTDDETKIY